MPGTLPFAKLREIEREFEGRAFLGEVPAGQAKRTINEQFGVYDAKNRLIGCICAESEFFAAEELRREVKRVLKGIPAPELSAKEAFRQAKEYAAVNHGGAPKTDAGQHDFLHTFYEKMKELVGEQ